MTQTLTERLHIVEGTVWKDAVISLLDSRCRYQPWRFGFGEAHMGDPVAIVLNTDPPSVLTELGTLGADGRPDRALIKWPLRGPGLIDLTTLAVVGDYAQDPRRVWQLRGDAAIQMELVLNECSYRHDRSMRFGHSSVAEARILLHSRGQMHRMQRRHRLGGRGCARCVHPYRRRAVARCVGASRPNRNTRELSPRPDTRQLLAAGDSCRLARRVVR